MFLEPEEQQIESLVAWHTEYPQLGFALEGWKATCKSRRAPSTACMLLAYPEPRL
jgi:hypothetical protein